MALSNRERLMVIGAAAAFALYAGDRFVLSPYLERRQQIADKHTAAVDQLTKARRLLRERDAVRQEWADLSAAGLKSDPSEAERQMLNALHTWAQEAGVVDLSLKPERTTERHGLLEVSVHATGSGPMPAIARLLWRVEGAAGALPVRVIDMQLSPLKEGTGDLQLQLHVSTLCHAPEAEKPVDRARSNVAATVR